MTIRDLLAKLILPKKYYFDNFVFLDKYKEEAKVYLELLSAYDFEDIDNENRTYVEQLYSDVLVAAKTTVEHIIRIIEHHESSDIKDAQIEFDLMMDGLANGIFKTYIDGRFLIFDGEHEYVCDLQEIAIRRLYRIRPVDSPSKEIEENPYELFHIPFNKRAYSSNERFNLAGYPCLYLSTALPMAWQECGYPKSYYYSAFQYEWDYVNEKSKEFEFLTLYPPQKIWQFGLTEQFNHFKLWINIALRYLKTYPLTMACSFVNHNGNSPYKQEYIISQMLMQWVQRHNTDYQGISYFSCVDLNKENLRWNAYNIAIPAFDLSNKNPYSQKLIEKFTWTRPKYRPVAIYDKDYTENDLKGIQKLIEKIEQTVNTYPYIVTVIDFLYDVREIACNLFILLDDNSTISPLMAIHYLNLLDYNCKKLIECGQPLIKQNKLLDSDSDEKNREAKERFKEICYQLASDTNDNIRALIRKYLNLTNVDFNVEAVMTIHCKQTDNIEEPMRWLREHHILHLIDLVQDEKKLNDIIKRYYPEEYETKIRDVQTPVFEYFHDKSIYDLEEKEDFIVIGFDKKELANKLNIPMGEL